MGAAAQLFGMSAQDLRSALAGGQSLDDIAKAKGVSQDDLRSTITHALSGASPQGSSAPSDATLDRIADRIATHHGGHHGGHGHHHHMDASSAVGAPTETATSPPDSSRLDTVA